MKKVLPILFSLIYLLSIAVSYAAAETEAEEILAKAHLFGDSPYLKMSVVMHMVSSSGEKSRGIDISMSNIENEYRVFMQITAPAFLKKMKFLQHNPKNGKTLQWVATSRGARKITSSGQEERIFDSDFTAADFSSLRTAEYRIESFLEVLRNEVPCYRFELTPLDQNEAVSKKILFLDRQFFLIREVEYYAGQDLRKRYRIVSTKIINGNLFPEESLMEDIGEDSSTTLIFNRIEMPASIPDRIFHYRNL